MCAFCFFENPELYCEKCKKGSKEWYCCKALPPFYCTDLFGGGVKLFLLFQLDSLSPPSCVSVEKKARGAIGR